MPKLLLPIVAALAVGGSAAGASVYLLNRGDSVEEVPQSSLAQATATPTAPAAVAQPTPTPTAAATATPAATEVPVPDDWKTYTDPQLGFKIEYPQDLTFADLTTPGPGGLNQRVAEFRSAEDPSRAMVVVVVPNDNGLSIERWALEFTACRPKSIQQTTLAGRPAISCTTEAIEGQVGREVLLAEGTSIISIQASSAISESEFSRALNSFGL